MSLTIRIPAVIHRELTPNGRAHWRTKHRLEQELKAITYYAFRRQIDLTDPVACFQTALWPLTLDYVVARGKGRQPMDDTNIKAGLKYLEDGIATALGIDDKHFRVGTVEQIRDMDGVGYVDVTIRPLVADERQVAA